MSFIKSYFSIIIMGIAVIVSGVTLMMVSQRVYETQNNVQTMSRDVLASEWEIRALRAELAFLTRPDRLEQISSAITNNISPLANDKIAVAPVFYQLPDDVTRVIPSAKPLRVSVVSRAEVQPERVVPEKIENTASHNFSAMLSDIGGDE